MKREELIKKWLDNELNPQELEAFKALEDYTDLIKLSENVKRFEAPEYNSEAELQSVIQKIGSKKALKDTSWLKPLVGIAAVLTIFFGVRYYNSTLETEINTLVSEKTSIELPDASNATLNALSSLKFNNRWTNKREVRLEGEAFFKVAKGSKFDVITNDGIVSVLGTQFNVKHREGFFEVVCYEGLVGVTQGETQIKLRPGDSFTVLNGKVIAQEKETQNAPSWLNNESYFKSMPFKEVVAEFERQYNVTITSESIDTTLLFTGNFKHNDMDLALKSITLPLNLKYSLKNDSTIVLSSE